MLGFIWLFCIKFSYHVAIINILGIFPLLPVIIDGLISTYLFALLGVPVWYVVQFYKPEKATIFNLLINHITLGIAVIAGWFFISSNLIKIATAHWLSYQTFQIQGQPLRVIYGIFLYLILTLIYYLIIYYNNLQDKVKSEARLQEMIKEVELDMLKSQINPHFLFNSLNSISSLTITAPQLAREMLVKLSDYLRYSVSMDARAEYSNIIRAKILFPLLKIGAPNWGWLLSSKCSTSITRLLVKILFKSTPKSK